MWYYVGKLCTRFNGVEPRHVELGCGAVSPLERCPHFRGWYIEADLLERCPHFRGWYIEAREVSSFQSVLCTQQSRDLTHFLTDFNSATGVSGHGPPGAGGASAAIS